MTLCIGHWTESKVQHLAVHWAKYLGLKYPTMHFVATVGLEEGQEESIDEAVFVDLGVVRSLAREPSVHEDL